MHVLIIAQYFPPDMGGGATRAYNVAKGLVLNGCRVTVVSAFPHYPEGNIPKEYRWKPLKVEFKNGLKIIRTLVPPLPSKGLVYRFALIASFLISSLFALPIIGKVDIIWAANPNILSIIPAMIYGLIKRCPITLNVDDLWPEDMYSLNLIRKNSLVAKIAELLARMAYHKAKAITPISPGYLTVISGRYHVSPNKIHIVRAGVDTSKFKLMNVDSDSNGFFRVLYSGAFSVAYDFDQVLMAARLLEKERVEFILQGGGELLNDIKNKFKELNLKNVRIIDRILSREEVAELLNTADALILPLKDFGRPYLGISSKLYEYQAVGKPIICCATGQPARYIEETGSGIVVKPGDSKAIAKTVLYLKQNEKERKKLGENGRRYVLENLRIERIGETMRVVLEKSIIHGKIK